MIFSDLSEVGDDPILLVSTMYRACENPNKVDLVKNLGRNSSQF